MLLAEKTEQITEVNHFVTEETDRSLFVWLEKSRVITAKGTVHFIGPLLVLLLGNAPLVNKNYLGGCVTGEELLCTLKVLPVSDSRPNLKKPINQQEISYPLMYHDLGVLEKTTEDSEQNLVQVCSNEQKG